MILVTGATGQVGSVVCQKLAETGTPFRAFVRPGRETSGINGQACFGDFDDADSLFRAMADVSALFLSCAPSQDQARFEKNAISVASKAGVGKIVKLSGVGASIASPSDYRRANGIIEQRLFEGDVAYSILRPTAFTQNLLYTARDVKERSCLRDPLHGAALAWTDIRDVAAVTVSLLINRPKDRGVYELSGPEAMTYDDIAAKMGKKLGKKLDVLRLTDEDIYNRNGGSENSELAESMMRHYQAARLLPGSIVSGWTKILTGNAARSVDAFIEEHLERFAKD